MQQNSAAHTTNLVNIREIWHQSKTELAVCIKEPKIETVTTE